MMTITNEKILTFREILLNEEKSRATIQKYVRDVTEFSIWLGEKELSKSIVLEYKEVLKEKYAITSVNSVISSLNSFFECCSLNNLRIKTIRVQKHMFLNTEKELTKAEYERLLRAAKKSGNERLNLVMQTICSTGIRVSELASITVEAVRNETALIPNALAIIMRLRISGIVEPDSQALRELVRLAPSIR